MTPMLHLERPISPDSLSDPSLVETDSNDSDDDDLRISLEKMSQVKESEMHVSSKCQVGINNIWKANANTENSYKNESHVVPPLDLVSQDSSVVESYDAFQGPSDIDLRSNSDIVNSPSSEVLQNQTQSSTLSNRWNRCSQELQKRQLKQHKSKENTGTSLDRRTTGLIFLGNDVIAREVRPSHNSKSQIDFLTENVRQLHGNKKLSNQTYGSLFKRRFNSDPKLAVSFLTNEKLTKGSSSRHLDQHESYRSFGSSTPVKLYKQNKPISDGFSYRSNDGSEPYLLNCRPNPMDSPVQETGLTEYYSHYRGKQATLYHNGTPRPVIRKVEHNHSIPTSASGIYRMGLLQQAELAKAHKQFLHKYSTDLIDHEYPTRLQELCSVNSTDKLVSPHSYHSQTSYKFADQAHHPASKRYTIREYMLLPSIQTPAQGLGPDLDSDEYRKKLVKKLRQNGYAENLRRRHEKIRSKSVKSDRSCINSHRDLNGTELTNKEINHPDEESQKHNPEIHNTLHELVKAEEKIKTSITGDTKVASESGNNSSGSRDIEASRTNEPSNTKTDEELRKLKAAQKREMMLSYGKKVRSQLLSRKVQNPNSPKTDIGAKVPQTRVENDIENLGVLDLDSELIAMLRRHEEDRKRAEAIRRDLKIVPY